MLFKMFSRRGVREEQNPELLSAGPKEVAGMEKDSSAVPLADGCRLLYERIARGNALADAEEDARRCWRD